MHVIYSPLRLYNYIGHRLVPCIWIPPSGPILVRLSRAILHATGKYSVGLLIVYQARPRMPSKILPRRQQEESAWILHPASVRVIHQSPGWLSSNAMGRFGRTTNFSVGTQSLSIDKPCGSRNPRVYQIINSGPQKNVDL